MDTFSAGHYINRLWVVSFGCVLWGVMTAAFSCAPSLNFWSMLVWSITGLGLALVIPNVQSVIAGAHRRIPSEQHAVPAQPAACKPHTASRLAQHTSRAVKLCSGWQLRIWHSCHSAQAAHVDEIRSTTWAGDCCALAMHCVSENNSDLAGLRRRLLHTRRALTACCCGPDFFAEKNRGKAFGVLQMTSLLGGSLGALYATNLGAAEPFGFEGWRFAFFSVAMLSIIIGAAPSVVMSAVSYMIR